MTSVWQRGTVFQEIKRPGAGIKNRRFRQRKVGGATVVRLDFEPKSHLPTVGGLPQTFTPGLEPLALKDACCDRSAPLFL